MDGEIVGTERDTGKGQVNHTEISVCGRGLTQK